LGQITLHDVVGTIEGSLQRKEFALAAFLDIEGAFNNVRIESISAELVKINSHPRIKDEKGLLHVQEDVYQPYIIRWFYTAVVRPILTYEALVWWEVTRTNFHLLNLRKVQRIACLGVTGVRSTPKQHWMLCLIWSRSKFSLS